MTVQARPLAELTNRAIDILRRELGAADTLRFLNQFTTGHGDYAAERDALIGPMTLEEIVAEIKGSNRVEPPSSPHPTPAPAPGRG